MIEISWYLSTLELLVVLNLGAKIYFGRSPPPKRGEALFIVRPSCSTPWQIRVSELDGSLTVQVYFLHLLPDAQAMNATKYIPHNIVRRYFEPKDGPLSPTRIDTANGEADNRGKV